MRSCNWNPSNRRSIKRGLISSHSIVKFLLRRANKNPHARKWIADRVRPIEKKKNEHYTQTIHSTDRLLLRVFLAGRRGSNWKQVQRNAGINGGTRRSNLHEKERERDRERKREKRRGRVQDWQLAGRANRNRKVITAGPALGQRQAQQHSRSYTHIPAGL